MPNPKFPIRNQKSARRGGTYILVVGSALIISTLGLMALLEQRIQRKGFEATARMDQSRLNIESALRLGLLEIERDPNWRSNVASRGGEVLSESSPDFGDVTLQAIDPYDGNLTDNDREPIVLRAAATSGPAAQYGELTLHPTTVPPDVLWMGLIAGDDVTSSGGTIRCEMPISCDAITLNSANLYADVEAVTISGGTYHGSQKLVQTADRPPLPDINALISEYVSRGHSISISNIPTQTPNLLLNSNMEASGAPYWSSSPSPDTCIVERSSEQDRSPSYSLKVRSRTNSASGPIQDCTEWVKPNATYALEAWIFDDPGLLDTTDFRFNWHFQTAGGSESSLIGDLLKILVTLLQPAKWEQLSETMQTGSWSGELESSYIKIETTSGKTDFYVDDFSIREINKHFLYRRVLSPNSNPFSSTNPDGIYVIDCRGAPLVIERCRIVGTLVILNPGAGSEITGPISWEPARPGYPALIVGQTGSYTANMTISTTRKGLNETLNGTNFNPSGTPHAALGTDSDVTDILPSEIRGWVYVGGTLTFGNRPTVRGVVLAGDDVVLSGNPHIKWDASAIHGAPPGMEGTLELRPRPGARKKAVQ